MQIVDFVFCFLFPELFDICLARAKEKWRSLSTGGAEVECEGMLCLRVISKMKSQVLNKQPKPAIKMSLMKELLSVEAGNSCIPSSQ